MGLLLTVATPAFAAPPPDDRVGSPYFRVDSTSPDADRLPLKETRADVQIAGVIARVRVTQVYQNEGARPLEAVYVFPGSTRAAVFGMRMKVGDRVTVAQIQEKDAARRIYEAAKQQGKSTSLLEQERPNVFTMNVANILPGDKIEVALDYVELLVPEDGIYELTYPSVVGPRYTGQAAPAAQGEAWAANPYLGKGAALPYTWGLSLKLEAGLGIASITSPSHRISPRYTGKTTAAVEVDETTGGNKDFVLRYKLGGDKIETGVLLFPGATPQDESFFLTMVQPPVRLAPSIVPPREYIFVLDVSGSMHGYPLDTAKGVLRELIGGLRPSDRFNVMFFSGGSWVLGEDSLAATPANVDLALTSIGKQMGGGGTEILPALRRALAMKRSRGMSTSIVVVTDGYVSVERETFDVIREGLGTANLFSFGIGSSVNRFLIEGMARAGMGEPFVVLGPAQAPEAGARLKKLIESPVLTDVAVKFEGFEAYDVEPPSVPDLFVSRPLVIFGKYKGSPTGRVVLTGRNGQGELYQTVDVTADRASNDNVALRYLWARHRIARLSDHATLTGEAAAKPEITQLGLRYSLMTQYTSFVAVDEVVRNVHGQPTRVQQPLPLPEGVEESALSPAQGAIAPAKTMGLTGASSGQGYGSMGLGSRGVGRGGGGLATEGKVGRMRSDDESDRLTRSAPATALPASPRGDKKPELEKKEANKAKDAPRVIVRAPDRAKAAVERLLMSRATCSAQASDLSVSTRLVLRVSAEGRVLSVKVVGDKAPPVCVLSVLRQLQLAAGVEEELTVDLVFTR